MVTEVISSMKYYPGALILESVKVMKLHTSRNIHILFKKEYQHTTSNTAKQDMHDYDENGK